MVERWGDGCEPECCISHHEEGRNETADGDREPVEREGQDGHMDEQQHGGGDGERERPCDGCRRRKHGHHRKDEGRREDGSVQSDGADGGP